MKKAKETEKNSNAKNRMLPKRRPKNIRSTKLLFVICKSEASKASVSYYV